MEANPCQGYRDTNRQGYEIRKTNEQWKQNIKVARRIDTKARQDKSDETNTSEARQYRERIQHEENKRVQKEQADSVAR